MATHSLVQNARSNFICNNSKLKIILMSFNR